jgi:hypothetical protein
MADTQYATCKRAGELNFYLVSGGRVCQGWHVPSPDTRKRAKAPKTSEQRPSTYRPLSKQYKLVVLEDIHGRSHCHRVKRARKGVCAQDQQRNIRLTIWHLASETEQDF